MPAWLDKAKLWARSIKRDVVVVWLVAKDYRTPSGIRILAACVAAYALSPIDLVPDFVPVLGYLDDLLLVPLGIMAVLRLMPPALLQVHRAAAASIVDKPISRVGLAFVLALWLQTALAVWHVLSGKW